MTSYSVTYRDADGYRTERVIQADLVVDVAGVTTFRVLTPSGGSSAGTVVWQIRTNQVQSYYDITPGTGRSGD